MITKPPINLVLLDLDFLSKFYCFYLIMYIFARHYFNANQFELIFVASFMEDVKISVFCLKRSAPVLLVYFTVRVATSNPKSIPLMNNKVLTFHSYKALVINLHFLC